MKRLLSKLLIVLVLLSFSLSVSAENIPCECKKYPDASTMVMYVYTVSITQGQGCCDGTLANGLGEVGYFTLNEGQWTFVSSSIITEHPSAQSKCCN